MSAHTPGQWRVKGTRIFDCSPGIDCIASMQVSNQPNWEADARLIAAAPELLEALIDCRRALEIANFTSELAVVNAAIAKATGADA